MRLILALAIGLAISLSAHAEYRAFAIEITSADGKSKSSVKSTLDPLQYVGYHPVPEGASVLYTETWMCKGRTNAQTICPSPRELELQKQALTQEANQP